MKTVIEKTTTERFHRPSRAFRRTFRAGCAGDCAQDRRSAAVDAGSLGTSSWAGEKAMSNAEPVRSPWDEPGIFQYFVVCLGS